MICAMSERDSSAGAIFMAKTQLHHNGGSGGGGGGGGGLGHGEQQDTAMSDDVDSEVEDAAVATAPNLFSAAAFVKRHVAAVDVADVHQSMKRNKRKNFKPRSISFGAGNPNWLTPIVSHYDEYPMAVASEDSASDEESRKGCLQTEEDNDNDEDEDRSASDALDLTSGDAIIRGAKKFKLAPPTPTERKDEKEETGNSSPPPTSGTSGISGGKVGFTIEDLTSNKDGGGGAIDLSSTSVENDAAPPRRCGVDAYSDSNSCDSEARSEAGATAVALLAKGRRSAPPDGDAPSPPPPPPSHHPMFLNQPPTDASDLKEYAQNTVKELLQIYGLVGDASDVADCIDKNIPMSNFSSGKIKYTIIFQVVF